MKQHLKMIIVIFTTFLPCSEPPFHLDLKQHLSFPFANWPGKSIIQLNLSYPKYIASVQKSNLFSFCRQSRVSDHLLYPFSSLLWFALFCGLKCDNMSRTEMWSENIFTNRSKTYFVCCKHRSKQSAILISSFLEVPGKSGEGKENL